MSESISVEKQSFFGLLAKNPSLVFTIAFFMLPVAALYVMSMLGYSGLSYRIAVQLPAIFLVGSLAYLYITMSFVPLVVAVGLLIGAGQTADRYEFPLQSETPVSVKDVDILGGFLGLNSLYRVETTDGVFIAAGDIFHRNQALVVKRYASADGFAELTKLCDETACVAAEPPIPE